MADINYSVIIPHKNAPALLQRCIDSIPKRRDIQIIVVDDNSSLEKVDFDQFPGKNNEYVESYFTKEGRGAGYARNVGLKYARGKWIIFADADDFFETDAFLIFDSEYDNDADIIYFLSRSIYDDTGKKADREKKYNELINHYLLDKLQEVALRIEFDVPWAKMIRNDFIKRNHFFFDEVPASNDVYFSTLTGYYANKIAVKAATVYVVTVNVGSITRRRNYNIFFSQYYVCLRRNSFLKRVGVSSGQRSIMRKYIKSIQHKPFNFFYLTWLLIKFRQNPFVGCTNWIKTYNDMRQKKRKEEHYFTK
jgi:glycosyltransferase involved in cell wall biosynthesis